MQAYQIPLQSAVLPGAASGRLLEVTEDLDLRFLWRERMHHVVDFIAAGYVQVSLCGLSLLMLLAFSLYERFFVPSKRAFTKELGNSSVAFAWFLAQAICITAALPLDFLVAVRQRLWGDVLLQVYAFGLCMARFVCREPYRGMLYTHLNVTVFSLAALSILQQFLPLIIIGPYSGTGRLCLWKLVLECAAILIPFVQPRPRPAFVVGLDEAADEKTVVVSPEQTCSWFSYYCSYGWISQLIFRGCRRDLILDDLPPLPAYDAPLKWLEKVITARLKGGKTFLTLCRVLKADIRTMMFWSLMTGTVEYIAPYAMYRLLAYLEDPSAAIVHPVVWIVLLFVGPMARSISYQQYIFTSTRLLLRVDLALIQEIFQTMMRSYAFPDAAETKQEESGKVRSKQANVTTLMSYDVDAIDSARDIFYVATAGTVSTAIAMTLLYRMLGWPSLVGVLTLILLTPLPAIFSRRMSRIQQVVLRATDARLSRISEYLSSIRTFKYFGWETAIARNIHTLRAVEQKHIWRRNVTSAIISMTGDLLPLLSLLVMFTVYILGTRQPLRAPAAFTSLAIVETLRAQFVWLSNVCRWAAQGLESLRRVDAYLDSSIPFQRHPVGPPQLVNATCRRTPDAAFTLTNITLAFRSGVLNVVTGPTGAGKSSLLLSLLGETVLEAGSITCPADVAFVPQTAWLQNASVRDNILFYTSYDADRYRRVLEACGLTEDLRGFAGGDGMMVGEKGAALSGGQRQRVSLARAVYSHAGTVVLDDVFSALDAQTTETVWKGCFRGGLLRGRTVVLVTHLPAGLREAEVLVRLEEGRVVSVVTRDHSEIQSAAEQSAKDAAVEVVEVVEVLLEQEEGETSSQSTIVADGVEELTAIDPQGSREYALESPMDGLVKESQAEGRIPRTLFWRYMLLFGGLPYALAALLSAFLVQLAFFSITYWLSIWTSQETDSSHSHSVRNLAIYAGAVTLFLLLQFSNHITFQNGSWNAAKKLHCRLVTGILGAPIAWFDANPVGRALNRFGMDMQSVDTVLVDWLRMSLDNGLRFLLRILSIASIMPIFALPAAVVCSLGFAIGEMYTRAQVSVKRLCAISYSPVFSHFDDAAAGMTVIRARGEGMQEVFRGLLADRLAQRTRACEAQYNCNRWVSVRSDLCAATVAFSAGWVAYWNAGPPGLVGFSLTNAIGLSQTILTLVRNMNELEVELNSFQRLCEYADIEPEREPEPKSVQDVPASWPAEGHVQLCNVTVRYQEDGADILKDVSIEAKPGERVAIVGRTGSGKSTLGLSLLGFTRVVAGRILIDGADVTRLPLHRLRQSITMIPQDPVLFSGDVRENLDPFGEMDGTELQGILSACASVNAPSRDGNAAVRAAGSSGEVLSIDLDTPVLAGGENFSQGQRQILSLARAISRRSKVVLLDEATASVDQRTDNLIQAIIRKEFPGSTIIAIAHRLRTVMDFDKVIVMGGGAVLEFGSPLELIGRKGVFLDMLRQTGELDELIEIASHKS